MMLIRDGLTIERGLKVLAVDYRIRQVSRQHRQVESDQMGIASGGQV